MMNGLEPHDLCVKVRTNVCDVEYVRYVTRWEWWVAVLWQNKEAKHTLSLDKFLNTHYQVHTIRAGHSHATKSRRNNQYDISIDRITSVKIFRQISYSYNIVSSLVAVNLYCTRFVGTSSLIWTAIWRFSTISLNEKHFVDRLDINIQKAQSKEKLECGGPCIPLPPIYQSVYEAKFLHRTTAILIRGKWS